LIQIGDEIISDIALRLFCAMFWPYLDALDKWLLTGRCDSMGPIQDDFLIERKGDSYEIANAEKIPSIFRGEIARKILVTGRAVHLLSQLKLGKDLISISSDKPLTVEFSLAIDMGVVDPLSEPTDSFLKECARRPLLAIYKRVNNKLLDHIHNGVDLLEHLTALRRLYFMECGDVASHFVADLFAAMNDARSESSWLDARILNDFLQRAISFSVFHSQLEGRPVQLSVCHRQFAPDGSSGLSSEVDQLSRIRLEYEVCYEQSLSDCFYGTDDRSCVRCLGR
jgi:hypothetical protein